MDLPETQTLLTRFEHGILHVTLNRPRVRNAMNGVMVEELIQVFTTAGESGEVRAMVLHGAQGNFCAGGDIKDMSAMFADSGEDDAAYRMNRRFGDLMMTAERAPFVLIVVAEGAVLGGGFGLACVSDIALAHRDAQFGMPETGLGIVPAQIAPFVVRRVGLTHARRIGLLGLRFDSAEALNTGVVHRVFESELEAAEIVEGILDRVRRCAPGANAVTKRLMLDVDRMPLEELLDRAARDFATCLRGEEGREGTGAFRDKRLPKWATEES
ncbi:MAG: enoyl-CoA hydratase-related protein [Acidobacteriota bacterium]|nr:enoyl-CoA hydratase-related protein [Acidobacteriota bacterium]